MQKWKFINKDWLLASHKSNIPNLVEHHCINIRHVARITWWEDESGRHVTVHIPGDDFVIFNEDEFPSKEEWLAVISLDEDT
jgi:hypothetical protein